MMDQRDFLVLTHGGSDRRYKDCKCARCHKIAQCTPTTDFYTISGDDNGPLYCEMCFRSVTYLKGDQRLTPHKQEKNDVLHLED